ncbi:E3 ubiquitin/ISG15 ligase TRIM25-like [Xenopus tropicalis]|uniref:E3 ubiquitin/ISG15 ligase TRIM25-like n=1 Tax=Xenopus tropicalis TaxID=8364 RepID=A0A8J0STL8_XENTR|nr:E3 ubiquitin/ISG15 ligase TRIM25-like [Xenopus tropicalis]|eukprot:XP_012822132.1 PREDICTED: E3 ubiquitin/ISG15 ligase TRIM25-like [Xenopus tropicalis]
MAAADLRDELSCSICLSIYTDPVSLPCGHNFCRGCIGGVLSIQEGSGRYSCPECRAEYQERPALYRNRALGNIAERFRPTETEPGETGIFCTYCLLSPVPAAKSCLHCEASLCDTHLRGHCQSAEHVLTEPTASFMGRKCSVHNEPLKYHCCEDSACICASCCLAGGHRGHRVELLSEASEKKKEKLRKVLEKLSPEREETERGAQRLQECRREVAEVAAGETERVTALFRGIREELEALEKRLLSDISRQKEELCLQLTELIQQLEIKKDELSRKIRHIEELCNMADPLTVLQEQWESYGAAACEAEGADTEGREKDGTEGADTEGREREDTEGAGNEVREKEGIKVPAVGDLDVGRISETLLTGLAGIVTGVEGRIHWQEATELVLDINTAGNDVSVSGDGKIASYSHTDRCRPQTPERFQYPQALSTRSFPSGRHYWEVEVSESGDWGVGAAYPSIERGGGQSCIGNNNKSWGLWRCNNNYTVTHDWKDTQLPHVPSCRRIRISLDYEARRLSFYELSEPIRHLHTFTASFTEPLHAAFWVGWDGDWVRIIS